MDDKTTSPAASEGPTQDELINALAATWRKNPHLRLAQLVCNASLQRDPFYMSNGTLLEGLERLSHG